MLSIKRVFVTLAFAIVSANAHAIPIIAVDADPTLAGTQAIRTVMLGDTFDVLVTIDNNNTLFADGAFDTLVLNLFGDALFNATVTALVGAPTAGALIDTAPLLALDIFGLEPPAVGNPLALGGTSGTSIGVTSLLSAFLIPDAGAVGVALFRFMAAAIGSSVLTPTADLIDNGFLLAYSPDFEVSVPVASINRGATINVIGPPVTVPEPGTWMLLATGLPLLLISRFRRRASASSR